MGSKGGMKLSGMQKQVLSLYRGFLRAARTKASEERLRIESTVSAEFRRNARDVDRKNFIYIEYLLRRGSKQLDQLKSPETVGLSSLKIAPNSQSQADNNTSQGLGGGAAPSVGWSTFLDSESKPSI